MWNNTLLESYILIGTCRHADIQPDCIQRCCRKLAKVVIFCQEQASQPRGGFFFSFFLFWVLFAVRKLIVQFIHNLEVC